MVAQSVRHTLTVQFEHRMTAYALLALALLHRSTPSPCARDAVVRALVAGGRITLQATLGILTLLNQVRSIWP